MSTGPLKEELTHLIIGMKAAQQLGGSRRAQFNKLLLDIASAHRRLADVQLDIRDVPEYEQLLRNVSTLASSLQHGKKDVKGVYHELLTIRRQLEFVVACVEPGTPWPRK